MMIKIPCTVLWAWTRMFDSPILRLAVLCFFLNAIHYAHAADSVMHEADKLKEIQKIIERQGMEMPVHWQSRYPDEVLQYCARFLDDLEAGKDIEVIEPILRTDNPNDPALARFRSACRDTKDPQATYHDLADIGAHGFRLYRIVLDGNAKAPEDILYAEGNPRRLGNGGYYGVDLKRCTLRLITPCCNTALAPKDASAVTNINAIIRYRSEPYVLEMPGVKQKGDEDFRYGILLWGPIAGASTHQCQFSKPRVFK